jgi:hypothetical protein
MRSRAHEGLAVGGVEDIEELIHRPMEPSHEEDSKGETVCE